jgi:hypothetical protein
MKNKKRDAARMSNRSKEGRASSSPPSRMLGARRVNPLRFRANLRTSPRECSVQALRTIWQARREEEKQQQDCRTSKVDAGALWKQIEDVAVPRLRLSAIDHVVYSHLLRHSRLEGKRSLRFSIPWLARNIQLSVCPVRESVQRLAGQGALRLVERSKAGHVAEVRLPEEIRGVRAHAKRERKAAEQQGANGIEDVDFLKTLKLRRAIHARERGKCFYCLRKIPSRLECLDHVVPRAKVGCNSYRNLVSSCMECNSQKGERPAEEFLRWLFRERRLTAVELRGRFRALELLASGKLRPELASDGRAENQD